MKSLNLGKMHDVLVKICCAPYFFRSMAEMEQFMRPFFFNFWILAIVQVEHVIREQNFMAANEIIELFCELIVTRLPIIAKQKFAFHYHHLAS